MGSGVHFPQTIFLNFSNTAPAGRDAWTRFGLEKAPEFGYRSARRFRNRCFEHCMTSSIPAAALASPQDAISGAAPAASGAAIRTGILWMLAATCLFVCQDSTARILLQAYPATEIAFVRFFVHMVLVSVFIAWRDPCLMISRRPMLQMLRSSFLLGTTLFGLFALKIMPLVDFSAVVWVAPVLVAALSVFILHTKRMGKRYRGLDRRMGNHW